MKRTKTIVVLALALVMTLGMVTMAGAADEERSANIRFKEGSLKFNTNLSALDFDFGEYEIPAQRTVYFTNGTNNLGATSSSTPSSSAYNLTIEDTRSATTPWTCTVNMTPFSEASATPFDASVYLMNGTTTSNGASTANMTLGVNYSGGDAEVGTGTGIMVPPDGSDVNVITVSAAQAPQLGSGQHTVTWASDDCALDIGTSFQGNGIKAVAYKATMTWTLTLN